MKGLLIFLFLVADAASLYYMGDLMGFAGFGRWPWWYTLLYVLGVMLVGVWTVRIGGAWSAMQSIRTASQGKVPDRELLDGVFYLVGGGLLVYPGLLSDVLGLVLVVPLTRIPIRSLVLWRVRRRYARAQAAAEAAAAYARVNVGAPPPPPGERVVEVKDFKVE